MKLLLKSLRIVVLNILIIVSAKAEGIATTSKDTNIIIENNNIKKIVLKLLTQNSNVANLTLEELNIVNTLINESQKEEMILSHDCEIAY